MILLITGSRHWTNRARIAEVLSSFTPTLIIHGGAPGADTLAGEVASWRQIPVHIEYAEWERYGHAAGPVRNRKMLAMKPDLVIAFHDDIAASKGTRHCLAAARQLNIPTILVTTIARVAIPGPLGVPHIS